ncbi:winged helix-turn-helix transcriptional regulator [Haloarcula halophila]|uniref:winged helix-turn-helix transcriptional regulator n=1 Tax=Haloarcula TaxID=2237 RepID=UPI00360917D1
MTSFRSSADGRPLEADWHTEPFPPGDRPVLPDSHVRIVRYRRRSVRGRNCRIVPSPQTTGSPVAVSYSLTPKGEELHSAFDEIHEWGEKWITAES